MRARSTVATSLVLLAAALECSGEPLRVAVAGLVHGLVEGFLRQAKDRADVEIVGLSDPDVSLQGKYRERYSLAEGLFFSDLEAMLERVKPDAVAAFTSTYDHAAVVAACARRKIPVMMEKPLAVSVDHARAIERATEQGGIPVIVNYETTWYRSHAALWDFVKQQRGAGEIRRMVAMDGHEGPQEIKVPPEFFAWLTDPVKDGGGALYDFGCYGANLMTWLMDGAAGLGDRGETRSRPSCAISRPTSATRSPTWRRSFADASRTASRRSPTTSSSARSSRRRASPLAPARPSGSTGARLRMSGCLAGAVRGIRRVGTDADVPLLGRSAVVVEVEGAVVGVLARSSRRSCSA
jgi:hypothetical protein